MSSNEAENYNNGRVSNGETHLAVDNHIDRALLNDVP